MRDRKRVYLEIWSRIESLYFDGYMATSALFRRNCMRNCAIPCRTFMSSLSQHGIGGDTKKKYPDLVIVEKGQITDIFELKMWDVNDVKLRKDIEKLLRYGVQENIR